MPANTNRSIGIAALAASAAFAYAVLLGGTAIGEVDPLARALNLVIGGVVVGFYVLRAPVIGDRSDGLVAVALAAFALACLFSLLPRQSFDAAIGALTLAATLFVARGVLNDERRRRFLSLTAMTLSAVVVFIFVIQWSAVVMEWMTLTGWSTIPPLDLNFSTSPWGHRHDAALLAVMLYPAWWVGDASSPRKLIAVFVGVLTSVVVLLDGSRNLWLAIAVASLFVFGGRGLSILRRLTPTRAVVLGLPLLVGSLLLLPTLAERLLTGGTIAARAGMWQASLQLWREHPLTGVGPGTFPWVLQQTGWFDANAWAPRHPDSSMVQLLAESGLLGVTAVGLIVLAVGPAVIRRRSAAASWSLATFAATAIAASPTDFAFLTVSATYWAAVATPRDTAAAPIWGRDRGLQLACALMGTAIAGAVVLSVVGAVAYAGAASAIAVGDSRRAVERLNLAVALDPNLALYHRQRGVALLLLGHGETARRELTRATVTNPFDDTAWRALGLYYETQGADLQAEEAYERAASLQRSDSTNLLLLMRSLEAKGDSRASLAIASEIVEAWPHIMAAPGWREFAARQPSNEVLVDAALRRWEQRLPSAEPVSWQPLMLSALTGATVPPDRAVAESGISEPLALATWSAYSCRLDTGTILTQAGAGERRVDEFWLLRAQAAAEQGNQGRTKESLRVAELMSGAGLGPTNGRLSPVNENVASGLSVDVWGYRRPPVVWPPTDWDLPSWTAGRALWTTRPREASVAADVRPCR